MWNRGHIGPHVPLIQRIFCVVSIMAVPLGLATMAGGALMIYFMSGVASSVSAAVVLFVGFVITVFTPIIAIKVFDLRIRMYEGRPRIVKSYGEFPNNLSYYHREGNVYNVPDPAPGDGAHRQGSSRSTDLPAEREVTLELEEQSTSFGAAMTSHSDSKPTQTQPRPQVSTFLTPQTEPKVTSKTTVPPKQKPPRQNKKDFVEEKTGVYYSTIQEGNVASRPNPIYPNLPPRNVSSLHPHPHTEPEDNTSRTRI